MESIKMAKAPRPTITELAKAAGVSVATVDRVINARTRVKPKTLKQVHDAAQKIGFYGTSLLKARLAESVPSLKFGFLLQRHSLQFYEALAASLKAATIGRGDIQGHAMIEHLDDLSPANVAERLRIMGKSCDAVAIVAADHPYIVKAISELKEGGTPVITLLTDLSADDRAGYAGLDWRKVGRTAGWAMTKIAGLKGKVAIILGSHRYQAQEVCEMSFRSYLREYAPEMQLLEPILTLEEPRLAYQSTLDLIERTNDLVGVYMAGGGVEGVLQAFAEANLGRHVATICHDLTPNAKSGLIDGTMDFVLSHPLEALGQATVSALCQAVATFQNRPGPSEVEATQALPQFIVPIELYTRENV